jgi:two-component system, chemotaxis family, CheB/CheR fusion protein
MSDERPVQDELPAQSEEDLIARQHSRGETEEVLDSHSFPVVGVGASAGGLEAFRQFLGNLATDTGMAFILVQHLDPRHESRMTDLLSKATSLPVQDARHGVSVRPNNVHMITSNTNLTIAQGVLHVWPRGDTPAPHLPIDDLFRSLAEDRQAKAIGVVLSGTGSDGTLGLCEIKAVGGFTFAQDEKTAQHTGMPHNAAESGCVDFILPPGEIAQRLATIRDHPYLAAPPVEVPSELDSNSQFKKTYSWPRPAGGRTRTVDARERPASTITWSSLSSWPTWKKF